MNPEEILSQALKVAQEAEVFQVSVEGTPVSFEANRLKHLYTQYSQATVLRVVHQGRIGLASSRGQPRELVERAWEASHLGAPARFQFPGPSSPPSIAIYDHDVGEIAIEEMVGLGQSLIDQVRQHTPELVCDARVVKDIATVRLLNSRGGEVEYKKTHFAVEVEGVLTQDTDMLFVGDSQSSSCPIKEVQALVREVIQQLELARKVVPAPRGQLPVVFTPRGVRGALLAPLILAFHGRMVVQGASPLAGRLGEMAFDPRLSLWDDATIPLRPTSRTWDDEGVASQRLPLIQDGVVANFLYDLQTAGLAGTKSTGSATRGPEGAPAPMVTALVLREGEAGLEEIVRDINEGLVVERLIGAEQGNILGGEFSGNVLLGYKVEKGEIVGRVKNTMVTGNIYQALKKVMAIGKGSRWEGNVLTPPLALALSIASKD